MKQVLFYSTTLLLCLILNIFWDNYFNIIGVSPQIVLIVLVYFSITRGALVGEVWGAFAGLSLDVFSAGPFGLQGFVFTVIGFVLGTIKGKVEEDSYLAAGILVILVSLFSLTSFFIIQKIFFASLNRNLYWWYWIGIPFYNVLLSPLIYLGMRRWESLWNKSY